MPLTRNILMKPIAIGLIGSALEAVAAPAAHAVPTPAVQPHHCAPSQPSFTSLRATSTVSCREAVMVYRDGAQTVWMAYAGPAS
jgi:hypothetical protein